MTEPNDDHGSARPLTEHHEELRERLAAASGLLLCTDFDGTLAPIVADPDGPEITSANDAALRALTEHDAVEIAVVSGRQVDDVAARVGIDGLAYAGNHGLELTRRNGTTVHPIAAERSGRIEALLAALDERLDDVEDYVLEDKGVTATVHYRGVASEDVPQVEQAVEAAVEEHGTGLHVSAGKEIFEIGPAIPWDKGRVISLLAEDAPRGWIAAYLGDDTTDETAFRALGDDGISVFVGDEAETAARYRVPDPDGVARFLEWLASEGVAALADGSPADGSPADR